MEQNNIKIVHQDFFKLELNIKDKTATIVGITTKQIGIVIPKDINYNGQNYLISNIKRANY